MDDTTFCIDALSELFYKGLLEAEDFSSHVWNCRAAGFFLLRAALIKNLARFDDELMGEVPGAWTLQDRRRRTIITMLGEVTYYRRCYKDEYGNTHYLLDEVLGVAPYQRFDEGAFLWVVRMASNMSYEKTAEAFYTATGSRITRQSVMRCVHRAGELLAGGGEGDGRPLSAEALFIEFDGLWVDLQSETKGPARPRRTYKEQFRKKSMELKVWVAYCGKDGGRRIAPFHWASDAGPSEFFAECARRTGAAYAIGDADWIVTASDAASWCKAHGIDAFAKDGAVVLSRLDTYHVNQKVYRAFGSDEDRGVFLGMLYAKDFARFFKELERRMDAEPQDARAAGREDLYAYIKGNLDWLEGASLSRRIREELSAQLRRVFSGRPFCGHLEDVLCRRKYKRMLKDLERVAGSCDKGRRGAYAAFLKDAEEAVRLIRTYGPITLGTMEGTNSKVYAARLKVWGCAWSRRGALAMMRIRATLASGRRLIAPRYDANLKACELARIEAWRQRGVSIPASIGKGYEPPQGSIVLTTLMPPAMQAALRH